MELNIESLLKKYIEACVEYYYLDNNIMSDAEYDSLSTTLNENYGKLPDWFKSLVKEEDFKNGGFIVGYHFGIGNWKVPNGV